MEYAAKLGYENYEPTEEDLIPLDFEMDDQRRIRLREIEELFPNSDQCAEIMYNRDHGDAAAQNEWGEGYYVSEDENPGLNGPEWNSYEEWRSAPLEELEL